ncbi:myb-like protein L [Dendronephthya gigantea]|uniref:myb-like protein L n=1 Tax=Dendronephthya gigantea TaxID=151771 RepID=UPI00106A7D61|nr:myb-like protein L [Dendronephthya gigantea]
MEEAQDADINGIDRESLVKEIELIRQTLGGASTRAGTNSEFASYEVRDNQGDSDEDELEIIKSQEYIETSEETYQSQLFPVEVISSESEDETLKSTTKIYKTAITISDDSDLSADEYTCYEVSTIVPLNDSVDESEHYLSSVPENSHSISENVHASRAHNIPSIQISPNPEQSNPFLEEQNSGDYHLTELQPAKDGCQSSGIFQSRLAFLHHDYGNSQSSLVSSKEAENLDNVGDGAKEIHVLSDEEDCEVLNEQQRCLNLNRKYQTIIEAQLRKIEKLLAENREKQVGLDRMSSSSSAKAEETEHSHRSLSSYAKPYFRTRKECPEDNEDTKLRKSVGQPHTFQTPPRLWSQEDKILLSDAVKSEILQTKQMPLLRRLEVITPKLLKTKEDQKEIEDLRNEIERLKALSIVDLVQDFTDTIDFCDISNKVLPFRTPHQCQVFWYNELHPLLNKGKWEKEEDKLLLRLAEENSCGGNWHKIATELKSNRSAAQCLHRYQRSLNKNFLKSKWEPEDDKKLVEAVNACGVGPWEKVSSFLDGRTGPQCMHRYIKSLDPEIKKGKWEKEEDDLLRKGVELYGFNWFKFKSLLPRRTDSQVRERWQDVLDPNLRKGAFSKEEDERLIKVVGEQSVGLRNWSTIAKHMPGRTDNKCRRRWFSLMKEDPKTKEHFIKQKIIRAKLVNNFSRRRSDKPEIGPEDFDMFDLSETEEIESLSQLPSKAEDVTTDEANTDAAFDDVTNLDATSDHCASIASQDDTTKIKRKEKEAKENSTPTSPMKNRGKKRKKVSGGAYTNIQVKSAGTSKTPDVISSDEPESKEPGRTTRKRPPTTSMPLKSRARKEFSQSPSKPRTEPPSKMTNKCKLTAPNPSVVLQASSLPNAIPISHLTQFSVLLQAFSVDVSGALKNVNANKGEKSSQTNSESPSVTSLGQPILTTTITDNDNADKQMLKTNTEVETNNNTVTLRTVTPSPVVSATTPSSTAQRATSITKQGQGNANGRNKQEAVRSDEENNDGANTSGSSKSSVANTPSCKGTKKGDDSFDENASRRRRKRTRDNPSDAEKQKRLNFELAEQVDGLSGVSDVLSDSQHGLISTRPRRACKREYSESPGQSRKNKNNRMKGVVGRRLNLQLKRTNKDAQRTLMVKLHQDNLNGASEKWIPVQRRMLQPKIVQNPFLMSPKLLQLLQNLFLLL